MLRSWASPELKAPCPTCGSPVGAVCLTTPGRHRLSYPHAARYGAVPNSGAIREATRADRTCPHGVNLDDGFCYTCADAKNQTIEGPYVVGEHPRSGKWFVTARKQRTQGQMSIATFEYRTGHAPAYLPTREQAWVIADMFAHHMNALNVRIKDTRYA